MNSRQLCVFTQLTLLLLFSLSIHANIDSPLVVARGSYPEIEFDHNNNLHLVYARSESLFYKFYNAETRSWSDEQNTGVSTDKVHRSDPEIEIDSQGRPHVICGPGYAWMDNDVWKQIDPKVVRDTSLALTDTDDVIITKRGGAAGGFIGIQKRSANANSFVSMPDADTASGHLPGRNDHVYSDIAASPVDGSLHIVYRHGTPTHCAYRYSEDGGETWRGGGIIDDDKEAPSIFIDDDGNIYVITGTGVIYQKTGLHSQWKSLGQPIVTDSRDRPEMIVHDEKIYAAAFGGAFAAGSNGDWRGPFRLPALSNKSIGFVKLAKNNNRVYAVWEEGDDVHHHDIAGTSNIVIAPLKTPKTITVGQWDAFEKTIQRTKQLSNPYSEITLYGEFTDPNGETFNITGFYDGYQTWRVRYMPQVVGTHTYKIHFSDQPRTYEGSFECVESDIPGMMTNDETNPMWFGYKGGKHGLIRSFHVGDRFFARNWNNQKRIDFLNWAENQGYNTLSIASHYLNRDEDKRGRGWKTPDLWPLNPDEWKYMERHLNELKRRNMMVFPFAGFFSKNSDFPTNPAEQELYIQYGTARLGAYWNMMYNVSGPEPTMKKHIFLSSDQVRKLGGLIQKHDVYSHPVSVHNRTGDDPYMNDTWTTFGVLQGPKTLDRKRLSRGLLKNHHPQKPLYAQETLWGGNTFGHPKYTEVDIRKNAYVIMMSACALNFGDMDGSSSSGFSGSLELSKRHQQWHDIVHHVWDTIEMFPFYEMKPHQELVDDGYCLANLGKEYLVYLENGGEVSLQLTQANHRYRWINAQHNQDIRDGSSVNRQTLTVSSPTDGDDWFLHVWREN